MKITRLNEKQIPYFRGLDPFEMLEREDLRGELVLGLTEESPQGDHPAGLLLASFRGGSMVILWLYVAPDRRGAGYGEALLLAALGHAKKNGLKKIGAVFPEAYGRELICRDEQRFFTERHFSAEKNDRILIADVEEMLADAEDDSDVVISLSAENALREAYALPEEERKPAPFRKTGGKDVTVSLSRLKRCKLLFSDAPAGNAVSVKELSLVALQKGMKHCLAHHDYVFSSEDLLSLPLTWFEPEISAAVVEEGEVCGLFLLHPEEKGRLWAEYLCYAGKDAQNGVMNLLRFSAKAAAGHCDKGTEIIVRCHNKSTKALVERLFPDKGDKR